MAESLQKLYNDSFDGCPQAVAFEDRGDDDGAMKVWGAILNQISHSPAVEHYSRYGPANATEQNLMEAIHEIQYQCRERLDMLAALQLSKLDVNSAQSAQTSRAIYDTHAAQITPLQALSSQPSSNTSYELPSSYPEPSSRPPLPPRTNSTQAEVSEPVTTDISKTNTNDKPGRPSPEKYTMRTTLRAPKSGDKPPVPNTGFFARLSERPGANKAASLAWSVMMGGSKPKSEAQSSSRPSSSLQHQNSDSLRFSAIQWDSNSRRLVSTRPSMERSGRRPSEDASKPSASASTPSLLSISAASSALSNSTAADLNHRSFDSPRPRPRPVISHPPSSSRFIKSSSNIRHSDAERKVERRSSDVRRKPVAARRSSSARPVQAPVTREPSPPSSYRSSSDNSQGGAKITSKKKKKGVSYGHQEYDSGGFADESSVEDLPLDPHDETRLKWEARKKETMANLPSGVDPHAASQILDEIVVQGDEVHWEDVAGLAGAKSALREAIVYPLLRPDLFGGLREPAGGILLFGPPGTGKTMIARACATESGATFFSISASSLTSKYLGESEKLVRALFSLAKVFSPSIIFVDEIDSIMGQRSSSGEHEASRRIKTEFLIQWSSLQKAAAGKESENGAAKAQRVLVLAATNLPWAIDEAARRRFSRRQYIPLPDEVTRRAHFTNLMASHGQNLSSEEIDVLVKLTKGFSGSDITTLAKDAAMGPLRSLGEAVLTMSKDDIPSISFKDFQNSMSRVRPSVSKDGIKKHEDWARQYGETVRSV